MSIEEAVLSKRGQGLRKSVLTGGELTGNFFTVCSRHQQAQSSGVNVEDVIATQATPFNLPPPPDPVKTGPDKIKPDSKSTPRRSRRKLSKAEKKQRRSLENSRRSVDSRSSVESVPKARKKSKEIPEKV